jgi:isopenicillin-N N-acyltransferase-like protein
MRILKKIAKIFLVILGILLLSLVIFCGYVWKVSHVENPVVTYTDTSAIPKRITLDTFCYSIGENWLRKNEHGLFEMYTSGNPFQRGVINGRLSQELLIEQEIVFTQQIRHMIPSSSYLKFLRYIIGFMNRDLSDHVTPEYQQEIYGISLSAADSFQWIGSNYSRQLNYHAAHDIGHALQNLMLVGCTSFSAWDTKGRNFDFYMGDAFAKNKIVSFVKPIAGYPFAFVTWGGFIGVVSGMNMKGLTVTINAAKSSIPTGAATPVSLVAREILQYASNIQEAVAIAHKRNMFVNESFLIGSAIDHKSVIIEKTTDTLAVYDPQQDHILCANHYQSDLLKNDKLNTEQMQGSASVYRFQRTQQILQQQYPLTPEKVAAVLRDYKGMNNADIGMGNEKAINQMLAHHSIIFMPDSLRMWVSTSPWQLGTMVCYDLKNVFDKKGLTNNVEIANNALNIAADTVIQSTTFNNFITFRNTKLAWQQHKTVDPKLWIPNNPNYYEAYVLTGDYYMQEQKFQKAIENYTIALIKEIATVAERNHIEAKIKKATESLTKKP